MTTRPRGALAAGIPAGGDKGQGEWNGCNKCSGLFYNGYKEKGRCPAGLSHVAHLAGGFDFVLPFNTPAESDTQKDWRFCNKCFCMFYDGYPEKGRCPGTNGDHVAQGYNFVLHHDTPANIIAQPDWRFCNQCFVMFYDGFPQKGHCPKTNGGHVAQGHNFVLSHPGTPGQPIGQHSGSPPPSPPFKYCANSCNVCTSSGLTCAGADNNCSPQAPFGCYGK